MTAQRETETPTDPWLVDRLDPDREPSDDLTDQARKLEPRTFGRHAAGYTGTKVADGLLDPKSVLSWYAAHLGPGVVLAGASRPGAASGGAFAPDSDVGRDPRTCPPHMGPGARLTGANAARRLGALVLGSLSASLPSSFVRGRLSDRSSRLVLIGSGFAGAASLGLALIVAAAGPAAISVPLALGVCLVMCLAGIWIATGLEAVEHG